MPRIASDAVTVRFWGAATTCSTVLFRPHRLCAVRGDGTECLAVWVRKGMQGEKTSERPLSSHRPNEEQLRAVHGLK